MNICVSIYVCMYVHWYTYTEVNKSPLKGIKTCHSKICHFKGVLGGLVDSRLSLPCPRFNPWSGNWDPTSNMVWPKQKQNMSFWHKKCFKQKEFENWYVQEELSDLPPFPWSRPGDPHVRVPSRRVTSCPSCTPGQISIFVSEEEKSSFPSLLPSAYTLLYYYIFQFSTHSSSNLVLKCSGLTVSSSLHFFSGQVKLTLNKFILFSCSSVSV